MKTDLSKGLHLTINGQEGLVSLWDTAAGARKGMARTEEYLLLELTPAQHAAIQAALKRTR